MTVVAKFIPEDPPDVGAEVDVSIGGRVIGTGTVIAVERRDDDLLGPGFMVAVDVPDE